MLQVKCVLRLNPLLSKLNQLVILTLRTILDIVGTLSEWSRIIVLQDRSLCHIPLPPIQCCVRICQVTSSSCENQHWRKGETGMGVPTIVTSIVGCIRTPPNHKRIENGYNLPSSSLLLISTHLLNVSYHFIDFCIDTLTHSVSTLQQ